MRQIHPRAFDSARVAPRAAPVRSACGPALPGEARR